MLYGVAYYTGNQQFNEIEIVGQFEFVVGDFLVKWWEMHVHTGHAIFLEPKYGVHYVIDASAKQLI